MFGLRHQLIFASAAVALFCGYAVAKESGDKAAPGVPAPEPATATRPTTSPQAAAFTWETATPASQGIDEAKIKELLGLLKDHTYKNIHGVLLIKNGKLVVEEYYNGTDRAGAPQVFDRELAHSQQSATKSVNSILVGIAIDRHLISGIDEKLSHFFPEYADIFAEPRKDAIRLRDCLTMTAGLSWDESSHPYSDPRNDHSAMNKAKDQVRYVLERPLDAAPGTKFVYNSGMSITLGEVVKRATGMPADKFAETNVFAPLGITHYNWAHFPSGYTHTGGGLFLRPYDMAKIGYLYLGGGRWNGQQIVSEAWVRESTKKQAPERKQAPDRGYGYQWWIRQYRVGDKVIEGYAAQGLGGQFIMVIPELQLVACFTGWNEGRLIEQPFDMMNRFILPAALKH